MTSSAIPKRKAGLIAKLQKGTLPKCVDVKVLVLSLYPELEGKSDTYLGNAIAILATQGYKARHFNNFVECNPDVFDKQRFWRFTNYLTEAKTKVHYQPEYQQLLRGLSYQEAVEYVKAYKANKATSKAKFVERHGEKKGLEMFSKFQKTSAISIQNMKERGVNFREKSRWCPEYWINEGYTDRKSVV